MQSCQLMIPMLAVALLGDICIGAVIDIHRMLATLEIDGAVRIGPVDYDLLAPVRSAAPDTDIGPFCRNETEIDNVFRISNKTGWPPYNTHPTKCQDPECLVPGCVKYRETFFNSGEQRLNIDGKCLAVYSWWYADGPPGNRSSLPCPKFNNVTSTFLFKGKSYVNFMARFGHTYGPDDCHHNIMCSPSTHYFDESQQNTLKWCQETPIGFYSPQCENTLHPCEPPAGGMQLQYYSSHGMGVPTGCEVRAAAPALKEVENEFECESKVFELMADVRLFASANSIWTPQPKPAVVFGLLDQFFIGILPVSLRHPHSIRVALFHREWTVTEESSILFSDEILWRLPDGREQHAIKIQGNGTHISFWIRDQLISEHDQIRSTATIGNLNISGLPGKYVDGTHYHLGYFAVGRPTDFANASVPENNPYSTDLFTVMQVRSVSAENSLSLVVPVETTTSTTTIDTTTTIPVAAGATTPTTANKAHVVATSTATTTDATPRAVVIVHPSKRTDYGTQPDDDDSHTNSIVTTLDTTDKGNTVRNSELTEDVNAARVLPVTEKTKGEPTKSLSLNTSLGIALITLLCVVIVSLSVFALYRFKLIKGPFNFTKRGTRLVEKVGPKPENDQEIHGL